MRSFLQAHGYDPGPTQRPVLAGAIAGLIATVPAACILFGSGSLEVETEILRLSIAETIAAGCLVMTLAGAAYGRLFQRSANDRSGGWLFGMAYGFFIWSAGAMMTLAIVSGGFVPGGHAAIGVLLSLLAWGTGLGAAFPRVHGRIHLQIVTSSLGRSRNLGPTAALPTQRTR
jgi:hypothetical protein